ncbi:MAG: hypothetical protein ACLR17_13615 [Enterobacteriaceae bacterium]
MKIRWKIAQIAGAPWRVIGIAASRDRRWSVDLCRPGSPIPLFIAADFRDKPLEALTLRFQETLSPRDARDGRKGILSASTAKDFFVQTDEQLANALQKSSDSMSLLITAIAAISLLVGGVGVMNIMLVSVTERTMRLASGFRSALAPATSCINS